MCILKPWLMNEICLKRKFIYIRVDEYEQTKAWVLKEEKDISIEND